MEMVWIIRNILNPEAALSVLIKPDMNGEAAKADALDICASFKTCCQISIVNVIENAAIYRLLKR